LPCLAPTLASIPGRIGGRERGVEDERRKFMRRRSNLDSLLSELRGVTARTVVREKRVVLGRSRGVHAMS
jgi:hypothetical protein